MSIVVQVGAATARALAPARSLDDAARELTSISAELQALAPGALSPPKWFGTRLPPPELVRVDEQQAADATADVLDLFARRADGGWKDDDLCFARAVHASGRIQRVLQGGISGARDASVAGVAVAHMPLRRAGHHAAPVIEATDGSRWIVDWRMFPERGVVPIEDWHAILGVRPRQVSIQRTLDNAPVGMGPALTRPTTPAVLRYLSDEVTASLRRHGNRSPLDPVAAAAAG